MILMVRGSAVLTQFEAHKLLYSSVENLTVDVAARASVVVSLDYPDSAQLCLTYANRDQTT